MFAITGITGQVGGEVARNLLAARQTVRGVVRDVGKGKAWAERGCELVAADINDAAALTTAFEGVDGVFVLVPPNFDPSPDFQEARKIAATLSRALDAARPGRVVYLSTLGAQATRSNLLSNIRSSSKRSEICRCQSRLCGQHGSWRILAGTSPRPRTA